MAFLQHIISIYDPYKKLFIILGIFFIIFINCCNLNICIKKNNSNIQENNTYNPPNNLNSITQEPSVLNINIDNNSDNNDNSDDNENNSHNNDNDNIMDDKLPTYSEIYK